MDVTWGRLPLLSSSPARNSISSLKMAFSDEWIQKLWFIYTTEYYLAMRKKEILPFAATWMDLEGIMLSEISQAEKDTIGFHSFVELEKLNRRPWGRGREKRKLQRGREANHKSLTDTENKLRVDGEEGEGKAGDGQGGGRLLG